MERALAKSRDRQEAPKPARRRIRTMIVDDSMIARAVLSRIIESDEAFEIAAVAGTAEDAITALGECRVDVILLDWNMPVMSGMEFLKLLRQRGHSDQPKVVFCTTENDMAHIRAALEAGADEYVMKPFDRETLHVKLQLVGVA